MTAFEFPEKHTWSCVASFGAEAGDLAGAGTGATKPGDVTADVRLRPIEEGESRNHSGDESSQI